MLQSLQTSLIIVDSHTPAPKVYWNGVLLPSLKRVLMDSNIQKLKFEVLAVSDISTEMVAAGINVKVARHV